MVVGIALYYVRGDCSVLLSLGLHRGLYYGRRYCNTVVVGIAMYCGRGYCIVTWSWVLHCNMVVGIAL